MTFFQMFNTFFIRISQYHHLKFMLLISNIIITNIDRTIMQKQQSQAQISLVSNQSDNILANPKDGNALSFNESISSASANGSKNEYQDQSALFTNSQNRSQLAILTQSLKQISALTSMALDNEHSIYIQSKPVQLSASADRSSQEIIDLLDSLLSQSKIRDIHLSQQMDHLVNRVKSLGDRSSQRGKQISRLSQILKDNGIKHQILINLNSSVDQSKSSLSNKVVYDLQYYKNKYFEYKDKCKKYQEKINKLKQMTN